MKECKLEKWDNLRIGNIPNEVDQIKRMEGILISNHISANGTEDSNTIKKNLYNRNKRLEKP